MKHLLLISALVLPQAGCATLGPRSPVQVPPDYAMPDVAPVPVVDNDGGFTYSGGSLYSRRRARVVGDLLTIQVVHNTSADTKAKTNLKRQGDIKAGVTALMGLETAIAKIPGGGPSLSIETSTQNDYNGEGGTNRAGSVTGTLTTRVVKVMPNGHLVVYGQQNVRINNENEVLAVRGIVDPRSIGADNSVRSTSVSDLHIEYAGVGVVSGKQRPGWFSRILDVATPF
jgi:flagellar L-ring protein precursor FlgH